MANAIEASTRTLAELLTIEPMKWEDLDEVVKLEQACFTHPWTRRMFEEDIAQVDSTYYIVARLGGMIIGYAGAWIIGGEVHITTLAVHPKFRRRGIGETLLHALLDGAVQRGAEWAKL
ncbi:MAG TPA: GNAT family N-acetyltransferase, partial [Armatimonadetes bacterium]|nr:GNAT family N-acetyltransferase [Armatimonadota bacterium]